jgi:hypothetical protein
MTAPQHATKTTPPLPGAVFDDWREMQWVPPVYRTARRFTIPISDSDHKIEVSGCQAIGGELAGVEVCIAGDIAIETPAAARQLAADILAAADTLEALTNADACELCHGEGFIRETDGNVRCLHE